MNRKPRSSCVDRPARRRAIAGVCLLAAISAGGIGVAAGEELFVSTPLTLKDEYTSHIEGPAVNAAGDLFVVNIKIPGAGDKGGGIGRMKNGTTTSERCTTLPNNGVGNGIRFDLAGRMYVADVQNHIIHVFEPDCTNVQTYFPAGPNDGQPAFNQPNDLAIARDGTLYASDPKRDGTGRIWKITRDAAGKVTGKIMTTVASPPRKQGKTNGLDLSPDNNTLYVSESRYAPHGVLKAKAAVYAYRIDGLKLAGERQLIQFEQDDVDGLRVDTDGRIFVARPDAGEVAIIVPPGSPGAAHAPVKTTGGRAPTNLTFGGADGRDVFVTQADPHNILIERFRTDRPGREPCLQTPPPADCRAIAP